jgi:hypothetical protein
MTAPAPPQEPEETLPVKKRRGMLTFYVSTGAAFLLFMAGFTVWFQHRTRNRDRVRRSACAAHLMEIGMACHLYADDHDENFPPSLKAMMPNYIDYPKILDCCSARSAGLPGPHYLYVPGLRATHAGNIILMYESLRNHGGRGFHVAFADAFVEWWPADRAEEFRVKLANQQEAIRKWREAGAKKEDISKFFGTRDEKRAE